ncbi:unnamed protein product [Gongylonema pulchrum]|uniref:non-specific serine/threonine protein kinase n=1 Tax=Gongylonema pulchrum TaxID=637853 RepID=A0A183EH25_9BILA|nr:unnamed protein product [Gongylonema pulchrum]
MHQKPQQRMNFLQSCFAVLMPIKRLLQVENTEAQKAYLFSQLNITGKERPKLLDVRNYCKRNQSHSLVGTDNYMAPEVIRGTGHTQLCDWWSVGVILYEMIVNWRHYLDLNKSFGIKLSSECIDVIRRLCCEQEDRLGCKNGAEDLKSHVWFKVYPLSNYSTYTLLFLCFVRG